MTSMPLVLQVKPRRRAQCKYKVVLKLVFRCNDETDEAVEDTNLYDFDANASIESLSLLPSSLGTPPQSPRHLLDRIAPDYVGRTLA